MHAGPVISNNTALVALCVLGRLNLLQQLYGEVLIPRAVHDEFLGAERTLRQVTLEDSPWIKPVTLTNPKRARVYVGLDQGEAEVLALAEERAARLVIIDELKARRYAQRLGLPLTGTLGLLLLGKEGGFIVNLVPLLAELRDAGLHLGPDLIAHTLRLAGEE